ncbi:MAG: hypothetical protein LBG70_04110 [Bifidobacteriaceae bacterium]|jgi:hypothetical protein|nr:hypothetical protein [Bifidobacteriaceae bacterium]
MKRIVTVILATILMVAMCACSLTRKDNQLNQLDLAALQARTSDFQKEIIADGHVTQDEYEKAIFAQWQCVKEAGFSPAQPEWVQDIFGFSNEMTADTDAQLAELSAKYDEAYDRCYKEYALEVSRVWVAQSLLSPAEREAVKPEVIACLRNVGISVSENAEEDQIYAAMTRETRQQWMTCYEQYTGFFTTLPADG